MNSHSFWCSPNANSSFKWKIITRGSFCSQSSSDINKWAIQISQHMVPTGNLLVPCPLLHAAQALLFPVTVPPSSSLRGGLPFPGYYLFPLGSTLRSSLQLCTLCSLTMIKLLYVSISGYRIKGTNIQNRKYSKFMQLFSNDMTSCLQQIRNSANGLIQEAQ